MMDLKKKKIFKMTPRYNNRKVNSGKQKTKFRSFKNHPKEEAVHEENISRVNFMRINGLESGYEPIIDVDFQDCPIDRLNIRALVLKRDFRKTEPHQMTSEMF